MSLLRLGLNPDGTRHTLDVGPAYARRQGNGGAALGQAHSTFVVHQRNPTPLREKDQRRKERREVCNIRLSSNQNVRLNGEPCARTPGHVGAHRSRRALEHAASERRAYRPSRAK